MTNAERVDAARAYIRASLGELGQLLKDGLMTEEVYSMVQEELDTAMHYLYQSFLAGFRSEQKRSLRQSAAFALARAYSIMLKTNPDSEPRLKIAEAMRSLVA